MNTGESLGYNQEGELCIKTPSVMEGYDKYPDANTDAFTQDGFFRTGQ